MAGNIRIVDIAVYHPEKIVNNDFYVEYFKSKGKDIQKLHQEVYKRKLSYVIDPDSNENSLTMMIEAAQKVLDKTGLKGSDMDGIIVASQIPEYVVPACAVMVHHAIGGSSEAFAHDINSNCRSMLVAMENSYHYMQSNHKIKRVLIVGGEYSSGVQDPENELAYGTFGDSACALILERVDEGSGFIDSCFFMNNEYYDQMLYPKCGMSKIFDASREEIYSMMGKVGCDLDVVKNRIEKMLADNNLKIEDIGAFCFSQLLYKNMEILRSELNIPEEKSIFIADKYGYTGSTSPLLAFYESIEQKIIKRGDYVMFWTLGAGMQHIFLLIRY